MHHPAEGQPLGNSITPWQCKAPITIITSAAYFVMLHSMPTHWSIVVRHHYLVSSGTIANAPRWSMLPACFGVVSSIDASGTVNAPCIWSNISLSHPTSYDFVHLTVHRWLQRHTVWGVQCMPRQICNTRHRVWQCGDWSHDFVVFTYLLPLAS